LEAVEKLPSGGTWHDWLDSLERLAAMSLRHPEPVLSVLAELRPMSAIGPIHIDEVREVLTHRLTVLRVETAERRYGRVFVGTIPEAAGLSFHTVFVPGLGESIFPQRASEDPLLLDELRSKLCPSLAIQGTRVEQERFLFHTAAAAASHRLFVSYPRMTLTGERSRGPSFYALEVFRAICGRVPALQELLRTTAEASHLQAGWPAPREAANAIDDTEYDLAVIHRLTRADPMEREGAARYLLSANSNLARSLYARSRRWRSKWTESDGLVNGSDSLLAILETYRLSARPYSATGLQQFAACPYRFFLHSLVRLEPRAAMQGMERMDPLTRGSLFHTIQFRLLTALRDAAWLPIVDTNREHVLETADRIADATALEYRELLSPAISRVWNDEVEDIRWDLRGWLREMERESTDGHWLPRWFEFGFGVRNRGDSDPESSAVHVTFRDGTQLRGSIDMIEERDGTLRVTDHKTGKAPLAVPALTGHGEILQPLLYGQAAEILLNRPSAASRLFYCTDRGGYKVVEVPVHEQARLEMERVLTTIDHSIAEGFLPAAPRKGGCEYCDYRLVCGPYEETRLQRKNSERLSPLEQVRRTP
jgi:ATP-dependent helicase/DNAse subunit B